MNAKQALAQKNLTIMDGERRMRLISENGGTLMLRNEAGRCWQLTVENGQAVIVDAIAEPETPSFRSLWVEIGADPPRNSRHHVEDGSSSP